MQSKMCVIIKRVKRRFITNNKMRERVTKLGVLKRKFFFDRNYLNWVCHNDERFFFLVPTLKRRAIKLPFLIRSYL